MEVIKHCPDCVSEMKYEKESRGTVKNWYVCTGCGLRESVEPEVIEDSLAPV